MLQKFLTTNYLVGVQPHLRRLQGHLNVLPAAPVRMMGSTGTDNKAKSKQMLTDFHAEFARFRKKAKFSTSSGSSSSGYSSYSDGNISSRGGSNTNNKSQYNKTYVDPQEIFSTMQQLGMEPEDKGD